MGDDVGGGGETEGAGDKAGGAEAGVAVAAEGSVGGFGIGQIGAGGFGGFGGDGGFGGKDAGDAEGFGVAGEGVLGAELFADLGEEAVVAGVGEVGDPDGGGVAPAAGGAAGDEGDAAVAAEGDEAAFVADAVDAVDDVVEGLVEDVVGGGGGEELLDGMDGGGGVDDANTVGEGFGFGLSDGGVEGVDLAVDVGDADFVEVHEGEAAEAGAGEGFDAPGTDAAEADDAHVGVAQACECGAAVEAGDAAEALVVVGHADDFKGTAGNS